MRNSEFFLIFIISYSGVIRAIEYNGVSLGEFSESDVEGEVFLVNSTHLQIVNFRTTKTNLPPIPFAFISSNNQKSTPKIYRHFSSQNGEWLSKLVSLSHEQHQIDTRLIVKMTGSAAQWKQFAVVDSNGNTLASVNMNQKPSAPFCCFESEADMGLFGEYGIISDPIEVIDSRTLKIPKFSYKASQTPDGYFFAGAGSEIDQKSGKKAAILRSDQTLNYCPMLKDITDQDIIIRLDQSQTIYDIEWISVFCYKYSHDFGHLDMGLVENEEQVPPYIPDISISEPHVISQNC
ncbi:DM13 domain-containing protein [Caenorhabditis elegans]|uniref:DM13 domain-containing protein n=1 Tax=Caenorhabditis elegans TaxID=6239 RepID=Q9XTR0_CAEEL|nr:DM13 domain-containing protein [Caenorhabditis elegans]CAB16924.1 DM13 domain-containing protein [Caenorhabditis elegans]|eukprot:NP_510255.1 Uncharacterized protein CELE_H06A10.1 [Caenorhabditis elegans]